MKITKTVAQQKATQAKAEEIANSLNKEVIAVNEGKQHIQTRAGVAYELSLQDSNILDTSLIAKKVGNDLEVILEDSVVIFDNYFEVCTTDLSCLVSLPAEEGGLYHITADTFFNLEDGTQVVYFYGEQSIISTESSATTDTFQGFINAFKALSPVGQAGAVIATVTAVSIATSNDDNNNNDAGKPSVAVRTGNTSTFTLSLDEAVDITGSPTAEIKIGDKIVTATYASHNGKEVIFTFTVPMLTAAGSTTALIEGETAVVTFMELQLTGGTINKAGTAEAINIVNLNAGLKDSVIATLVVDETNPDAPIIALEADTGSSATDGITMNGKVMVSGLEAKATWKYSIDGGTTWMDGTTTTVEGVSTGSFTLAQKDYAAEDIQVKQFDEAGNMSEAKMGAIKVDTTAPAFGSDTATGTGIKGQDVDVYVYDATVTGGDAGITYTIDDASKSKFTIGAADGKIKYTSMPTAETTTADNITVTATDVAGNTATQTVAISVVGKPVGQSTIHEATNIDVRSPIVLTFTEEVTANEAFNITLTDANTDGVGWRGDKTQNNQVISLKDAVTITDPAKFSEHPDAMVIILNVGGKSIVTINPAHDFDFGTHYTVSIDAGAFTGTQASLAINMSFDTVTPAKDTVTAAGDNDNLGKIGVESQIQVAGTDALTNSNWWIDGHQSSNTKAAKIILAGEVKSPDGSTTVVADNGKDIAIAFSLDIKLECASDGNIMIRGITDLKDIVYEDIGNATIGTEAGNQVAETGVGWSDFSLTTRLFTGKFGATKALSPTGNVGETSDLVRVTYENLDHVSSDASLYATDQGQIIIG